jgi:hypothetical protein
MRHLIAIGAAAALLSTAAAARAADPATYEASAFTIGTSETPIGQELTVKPGQPLMVRPFWSETAAKLVDSAKGEVAVGGDLLAPGKTLSGMTTVVGLIYCAPELSRTIRGYAHCFEDADKDGAFDTMRSQIPSLNKGPLAAVIAEDGGFNTLRLSEAKPLKTKVRYTVVGQEEGPKGRYRLMWGARKTRDAQAPATLVVFSTLEDDNSLLPISQGRSTVTLAPGATAELDYHGTKLTFLGLAPDGSLRYVINAVAPPETIRPLVDSPVAARSSTITIPIPIGR